MKERRNQQLAELRGPERDKAVADLRAFPVCGLRHALASYSGIDEALIDDSAGRALEGPRRA